MSQAQLPAHLQNRQVKSLTERAAEGMGSTLPPHVSIQGNSFTFIDAAGNEFAPMLTFDAVIVDIGDRLAKRYYDKPYDPNATTGEPPRCWSANGITPTREIASPIHPTCEGCAMNIRGSSISKLSGAAIKACRDEKWIAFIVPQLPAVIFQMVITPGSFTNWKAYTETMRANGAELSFATTRFSFQPKVNGVLLFEFVGWIDEPTLAVVEAANREGKTDALVGRSDPVRAPPIASPPVQPTLPPPNQFQQPQQEVLPPQTAQVPFGTAAGQPGVVSAATSPLTAPALQSTFAAPAPSVTSPSEPARRRRRSAAEAPAAVPQAGPAFGQPAPAVPQAPFGQAAQPAAAAASGQTFGISSGTPVNADMLAMLEGMGFKRG